MSMPYICVEPEINPSEPHDFKFKPKPIVLFGESNAHRYATEKPVCEICGSNEENEICNRTFYD